jgi:hypothetical protein
MREAWIGISTRLALNISTVNSFLVDHSLTNVYLSPARVPIAQSLPRMFPLEVDFSLRGWFWATKAPTTQSGESAEADFNIAREDSRGFSTTETIPDISTQAYTNIASVVSQETIDEVGKRIDQALVTYLDVDDEYDAEDLDKGPEKLELKRRLDEQEKWCKVMNPMKPTEMVATAMDNINTFLLKEYGRRLLPERQLLFRSIFEKQKEMPEGMLDWLKGGSPRQQKQLDGFRNLQKATKGTTLRELAEVSTPSHPKRESVRVNEACRWIYRTQMVFILFCQAFHYPYKDRLWGTSDLSPGEEFYLPGIVSPEWT